MPQGLAVSSPINVKIVNLFFNPTDHSDCIVEKGLSKYNNVEHFVDVNLFKHGKYGHRIYGRDKGREEEGVKQGKFETVQSS